MRVDLLVPFSEKDDAKKLGARWDVANKVWYVPDGINAELFSRWIPQAPQWGIRSNRYFIGQTKEACWKCGDLTHVYCFVLPEGHETFEPDMEEELGTPWLRHDYSAILSYVSDLIPTATRHMLSFTSNFRRDFSKTTNSSYWMNHCEHCGMKQGDFNMFSEPGGAFFPVDERSASSITLYAINCLVPCDHFPRRSWPLFRAKAMLDDLIAGFSSPG
ncbi:hypothetical protein ABIB42_000796, partial [Massilia sp. UYP32]|uniref:DUF5710 domain-containing protein n=1 Tax=Massilia sp. UYP32 TaxID=1756386 RepID=UPI003D23B769